MSITTAIKTNAEDTRDQVMGKAEDVAERGAKVLEVVSDKAKDVSDKAKDAGDAAIKEITTLLANLNEKVSALGLDPSHLGDKAKSTYDDVEAYVTKEIADRPVRALAVVGLAGLAIGLLTRK